MKSARVDATDPHINSITLQSYTEYMYDDARGKANVTEERRWDSSKGGFSNPLAAGNSVVRKTGYNTRGAPTSVTDPRGVITRTAYDTSQRFPTDIFEADGMAEQRRTGAMVFQSTTGLLISKNDADNATTTSTAYDL